MSTIAWIGLGHMGGPMTAHLVRAGHTVRGVDLNPEAVAAAAAHGVLISPTIAEAVVGADAVITSLPKAEHVRAVYAEQILPHAASGTLLLDTSTVDVDTSRWCHTQAAERGLRFVDSPISGGTAGAAAGTLTFMLGGEDAAVADAAALVEPMAGNVIRCGPAGTGIAAKLANNLMLFINVMAMSEGSQLAESLGLDPKVFWDVANVSSGSSWALKTWYPVPGVVESAAAGRNFDATFSIDLARKDCALAVQSGVGAGVHMPAGRLALEQLDELIDEGLGHKDCTLVAKLVAPGGALRGYDPDEDEAPPVPTPAHA